MNDLLMDNLLLWMMVFFIYNYVQIIEYVIFMPSILGIEILNNVLLHDSPISTRANNVAQFDIIPNGHIFSRRSGELKCFIIHHWIAHLRWISGLMLKVTRNELFVTEIVPLSHHRHTIRILTIYFVTLKSFFSVVFRGNLMIELPGNPLYNLILRGRGYCNRSVHSFYLYWYDDQVRRRCLQ